MAQFNSYITSCALFSISSINLLLHFPYRLVLIYESVLGHLYIWSQTHHKHFLHFGDAFTKDGAKLIAYTSQQEAKQGYSQQSVDNTEYSSTFGMWRGVAKACRDQIQNMRLELSSAKILTSEDQKNKTYTHYFIQSVEHMGTTSRMSAELIVLYRKVKTFSTKSVPSFHKCTHYGKINWLKIFFLNFILYM